MHARRALPVVFASLVLATPAPAQVSITGGGTYTQNFDNPPTAMPTSGSITWAQNSTIPGWYAVRTGTGTSLTASNGNGTGDLYSFGGLGSSDRALGSVGSANGAVGSFAWGVVFHNDGTTPLEIDVSFVGEQWRNSTANSQTVNFFYKESDAPITETDFTASSSDGIGFTLFIDLNFASRQFGGTGGITEINGNDPANQAPRSADLTDRTGVQLDPGEYVALRWWDQDHSNLDHGLSVDNLVVNFTPVPEPATVLAVAAAGLGLGGMVRRGRRRRAAA